MTPIDRPPLRRLDDVLENGENVSRVTDRDLVLRAVNATLAVEQAIGRLTAEVAQTKNDVREIRLSLRNSKHDLRELRDKRDDDEITAVRELKKALAKAEAEKSWWVRWGVTFAISVFVGGLGTLLWALLKPTLNH